MRRNSGTLGSKNKKRPFCTFLIQNLSNLMCADMRSLFIDACWYNRSFIFFPFLHEIGRVVYSIDVHQLHSARWGLADCTVKRTVILLTCKNSAGAKKQTRPKNCSEVLRIRYFVAINTYSLRQLLLKIPIFQLQKRALQYNILVRLEVHYPWHLFFGCEYNRNLPTPSNMDQLCSFAR